MASPSEGPLYLDPLDALDPLEPLVGPLDAMAEEDGEHAQGSTSAEPPAPPNPELVNEVKNTLWRRYMEQSTVFNATNDDEKVLKCFNEYVNMVMEPEFGPGACPVKFDGVSCWPETPPGTLKAIPCFDDFNGVPYEPSGKARRYLWPRGRGGGCNASPLGRHKGPLWRPWERLRGLRENGMRRERLFLDETVCHGKPLGLFESS